MTADKNTTNTLSTATSQIQRVCVEVRGKRVEMRRKMEKSVFVEFQLTFCKTDRCAKEKEDKKM